MHAMYACELAVLRLPSSSATALRRDCYARRPIYACEKCSQYPLNGKLDEPLELVWSLQRRMK